MLKDLVSDLLDQFASEFKLQVSDHVEIETGLTRALSFCAGFALHPEIVGLQRLILQETSRFPELASSLYTAGILRTTGELSNWLSDQLSHGLIVVGDCDEAAEILIGMVVSEPQRANLYAGRPPTFARPARTARSTLCRVVLKRLP